MKHVDKRSAASAGMRLPSWRGISLQVAEGSTWQRLAWTDKLDKRLMFGNTVSAANIADFRARDAGQFHQAADLQS